MTCSVYLAMGCIWGYQKPTVNGSLTGWYIFSNVDMWHVATNECTSPLSEFQCRFTLTHGGCMQEDEGFSIRIDLRRPHSISEYFWYLLQRLPVSLHFGPYWLLDGTKLDLQYNVSLQYHPVIPFSLSSMVNHHHSAFSKPGAICWNANLCVLARSVIHLT